MSDLTNDPTPIFIDYETFWGTKYSLRSPGMSYTDYIFDEKFQIHGASVAVGNEEPKWYNKVQLDVFFNKIKGHQARGETFLFVAHNALFDGLITTFVYDFVANSYFCTLAMIDALYQGAVGRSLNEAMKVLLRWETGKTDIISKLKDIRTENISKELSDELVTYANDDLWATIQLYYRYGSLLPPDEHKIMNLVLLMCCRPTLKFNDTVLREAVKEAEDDRENRIQAALSHGATQDILKGNKLFPEFLKSLGYEVPLKPNSKETAMIPAFARTDKAFQQMLESPDQQLQDLAQGRLAVKSTQATTRAHRFLKLHESVNCFPVAYNYARAHTWRVSGANKINPANLKRGSKLRTCIEAPEGYVLGVADASQIECRGNGYIAGQQDLMQLFKDKRDPYNDMASTIFNRPVDRKNNPDDFFEGFLGKTATLGLGFGMGGPKFKLTVERDAKVNLGMDVAFELAEANRIVYDIYRKKNYKIKEFWDHCTEFLYAMVNNKTMYWDFEDDSLWIDGPNNKIFFPNGTWLYYPGIDCYEGNFTYLNKQGSTYITKYIYGALCAENIAQHFARNITSWHGINIAERYQLVLHTYDEWVGLVPEKEADEGTQWMINQMKITPPWCKSIPLDAEGGWAKEYSK